jgi:hypothetical protein
VRIRALEAGHIGVRRSRARYRLGHEGGLWRIRFAGPRLPLGLRAFGLLDKSCARDAPDSVRARLLSRGIFAIAPMSVAVTRAKSGRAPYRSFETRRVIIFARGKEERRRLRRLLPSKSAFRSPLRQKTMWVDRRQMHQDLRRRSTNSSHHHRVIMPSGHSMFIDGAIR